MQTGVDRLIPLGEGSVVNRGHEAPDALAFFPTDESAEGWLGFEDDGYVKGRGEEEAWLAEGAVFLGRLCREAETKV
jgi:hypothetical protein